ncbi:MAG: single-stranded-DNA-specific exonuclease RecJ [Ruminococcus sp.]|nr:single-stranded-DNA-specific exonuclease RecJ [Ruminococcus sp.]
MKQWKIAKADEKLCLDILRRTNLGRTVAEVLVARGLTDLNELNDFFNNDELEDPFCVKDMDKAVDAINEAVQNGERICIYGDYDCDGVTSTAILYTYLEMLGADISYYIPERSEGYGLNKSAVDKIYHNGASLIITVDNGISAAHEAEYIAELGMKLVITDHHQPPEELPDACAVVDPHRSDCPSKFKELSGAGVALKLIAAMEGDCSAVLEQFCEIASIGTVADVVSLTGENRIIVRKGLEYLKNTENYGLSCLMEKCALKPDKITSTAVAFTIAPRINAAGRFGSAETALQALICEDESAEEFSNELVLLNAKRKEAEEKILAEILSFIDENPEVLDERVLVLAGRGWHHGVIGIVAAKLLNIFSKPVFLASFDENGVGVGSVRSMEGYNVFLALNACSEQLVKFGGHEKAGGFTVREEKMEAFRDALTEYSKEQYPRMPKLTILADKIISPDELTVENIKTLSVLEPFGEGNLEPVFAMPSAIVKSIYSIGKGKHSKITVSYGGAAVQALIFNRSPESLEFNAGDTIDILANVSINEYNGNESLTIKVVDYRLSGISQSKYFAAFDAYEAFKRGEELDKAYLKALTPDRRELVAVYKAIGKIKNVNFDRLYLSLRNENINYAKMRVCLDIFEEKGLATLTASKQAVTLNKATQKVDLESSHILQSLRNAQ